MVDRDAGEVGEKGEGALVFFGERLTVLFVGEVEVAVRFAAGQHRHTEEGVHLGMAEREAVRARVVTDLVEPQRHGVGDQLTEHALTARQRADPLALLRLEPERDEARERRALLVKHADRGVASAGELTGGDEHAMQDHLDIQLAEDAVRQLQDPFDPPGAHG